MNSAGAANAAASVDLPAGFACHVGNIGIKDGTDDVMVLAADRVAAAAGVFTKSLFSGASVRRSQANIADGRVQAVVVISKNSNVATGAQGERDAANLANRVAELVGCEPGQVLVGSTGLIGVPYPEGKIDTYFDRLIAGPGPALDSNDAVAAATAIMTTDTHPKTASASAGAATVVGIAKGSGMIEPDMATMISVITTDAEIAPDRLDAMLRRVCDVTFNALSVDTDTSTSDMVVMLANGAAGPVDEAELETALGAVSLDLTRQLAFDGEGAETLIVVTANGARDDAQAKRVAKVIVNSPLVKTAVHGRDPNWGRVAMAIGKCSDETDIDPDRVRIRFGDQEVYPTPATAEALAELEAYLASDEVLISVDLGVRSDGTAGSFTVYGCDLTDQYVRINADYTT
ncbi:MAG: bifunctional glutamate N-acetyltransferase/amino-acid acetyltransferase ArgJ [Acidimicrobiales bacterium]|uniref:bifunctional glutamate N-acetyltransferase/amino-acid acetyltransferase ArgJ n=1 Tax=Candidatus Poriferisodalis multihospitum TaxID=2983191 RepID=UPI001385F44A|nr:bifunctional glutamate N-acetyltransferase/amino-acid acetyltransferase ArgJ [Candidatus Poriferisodalis multihospitum]MYA26275.1 bifunctional glutamate N-acetyltransferase/amino-acid acetyltransferase ArgJ [Acidimicrobiales bacterium]MYA82653.1 bifunctional glutamate N-acetyltransferase/amino-acid acetyltransferase ArgJ [Acidimicrobiales bacterium]MYD84040.1 bifunctional glutamate N-acetyltransferase/amino-acid acetyltransferase ArgJ [Acidimicrobiales bacterium]MYH75448.1 bifunctional gluta